MRLQTPAKKRTGFSERSKGLCPGPSAAPHLREKEGKACEGRHCPLGQGGGPRGGPRRQLGKSSPPPPAPQPIIKGAAVRGSRWGRARCWHVAGHWGQSPAFTLRTWAAPPRFTSLHERKLETTDAPEKQPLKIVTTTRPPAF